MPLEKEEKYFLLRALSEIEKVGAGKIVSLLTRFGTTENLLTVSLDDIASVNGIGQNTARKIHRVIRDFPHAHDKFSAELEALKKLGGNFITLDDEDYPEQLKNIYLPPLILYYLGEFKEEDKKSLAIVGTRRPSHYGKITAERLASELTENGFVIVSGMARGIDSIAHESCLKQGGRTIAVIGSGLDVIYPPENKELFRLIHSNGMIITEYPLGTKPDAPNFPRRNRIISGLALGTLIVETRVNGGAMHTAAYALDQGREIFAVPGNITSPPSEGCNLLIKKGEAKLVQNVEDILNELPTFVIGKRVTEKTEIQTNVFEAKILEVLGSEPMHIDKIAELTGFSTSDCLVHLLSLEFKEAIRQLPGKFFVRI